LGFRNMQENCSNLLNMRNLQEQVKKADWTLKEKTLSSFAF